MSSTGLSGQTIGDWELGSWIDGGASGDVYRASRSDVRAAVKVYKPDILKRSGEAEQLRRIDRQLQLRGIDHPHLVEIKEGGRCPRTGMLYVAMAYEPLPSLAKITQRFPRKRVGPLVAQVASAARFLEKRGLVHGDIKPGNILVSPDFQRAVLIDLGVLTLLGASDSQERAAFFGTTRYGPPEALDGTVDDSLTGWRAVTFYQLGAVLYDLLAGRRIFGDIPDPSYEELVDAVRHRQPSFDKLETADGLVSLSRDCLAKAWDLRLRKVRWDRFERHSDDRRLPP